MKKTIICLSLTYLVAISLSEATELVIRLNPVPQKVSALTKTQKPKNFCLREHLEAKESPMAPEVSQMREQLQNLKQTLAFMGIERDKEKATKESLYEMIRILKQEQMASKQLLNQVLIQKTPQNKLEVSEIHLLTQPLPLFHEGQNVTFYPQRSHLCAEGYGNIKGLSTQQKQLHSQRNFIGEKAWALLDGTNPALSQALLTAIQGCPGQKVDVVLTDIHNFKLIINGKIQSHLYKFL